MKVLYIFFLSLVIHPVLHSMGYEYPKYGYERQGNRNSKRGYERHSRTNIVYGEGKGYEYPRYGYERTGYEYPKYGYKR